MRGFLLTSAALFAAATVVACITGSENGPMPVTPPPTTESFMGTVQVGGSDSNVFNVLYSGQVSNTLTAAGPPTTIMMGLAIGQPAAAGSPVCTPLNGTGATVQTAAGPNPQIQGTVQAAGIYCVKVSDIGQETAPITYSVTVIHP